MRRVYTVVLYLLIPFLLLRLYWKSRRMPAYRFRIKERFGLGKTASTEIDVWVHAVSLGEVVAATPLIDALLAKQYRVLVTTMTPTGSEQVVKRFGNQVSHQYVPYDLPWALRRFFKQNNPRIGVIMETELWPNLIHYATRAALPLLLANARLSDGAFERYQKVRFFFKPLLNQFKAILAQSDEDARRFIALGACSSLVTAAGNMKFDLQLQVPNESDCLRLQKSWGQSRTVIIAASTHDDEERQLLSRLASLKTTIPDVLLLIAPRHPQRFQTVYALSTQLGFNTALRSQPSGIDGNAEVIVIDTLGELLGFYQVSDYAFVGGSLVPVGGHNVLEPIAMQVPVFTGPYMHNSKSICHDLCKAEGMQLLSHIDELIEALITMHKNPLQRGRQVANASEVLAANKGSVARHMERIESMCRTH